MGKIDFAVVFFENLDADTELQYGWRQTNRRLRRRLASLGARGVVVCVDSLPLNGVGEVLQCFEPFNQSRHTFVALTRQCS